MPAGAPPVATVQAKLSQPLVPGGDATLEVRLSIREPFHVNANPASEDYLIPTRLIVAPARGVSVGRPTYPEAEHKKFAFFEKPLAVYEGEVLLSAPVKASAAYASAPLSGEVEYQACDDKSCLPPAKARWSLSSAPGSVGGITSAHQASSGADADAEALRDRFGVRGLPTVVFVNGRGNERTDLRAGEELTLTSMTQKLDALSSGQKLEVEAESADGWLGRLKQAPLWLQLGLVFLGGLLLNLTPCVYPMIPITVGYFGAQSEGRTSKTFGLALFYVLGLALVYSLLGLFAAYTGNLFGSAMQSPWVLGIVAVVLGALALSMAGLFTLNPPQWAMSRAGAKKGAVGALAMGALLGIVAAPCVGPVVAALLTYVGSRGEPLLGFSLFFVLALGLGVPYLLLGTFSGAIKSLPRSGAWLEKSKKLFALPLLIAAGYYAYLAVTPVLAARALSAAPTHKASKVHWPHATLSALETARAQNRPVVLDFRADWCLPCLKMEREIFSREEVSALARKNNALLLQVDLTRAAPQ
jgi:thiol:disulfide interchange protein DsbD